MTFSIVARDLETGDLGIAVQSKFPAVGSLVPWLKAEVGAIATQALANLNYGRIGLTLLKSGFSARQTLKILLENDPDREERQVGIVDAQGNVVAHTGNKCYDYAGHIINDENQVTCQGNILIKGTLEAMMNAYLNTKGDLPFKLLAGLVAGQDAGGDTRGQQSAALVVYRKDGGYGGGSDIWIDVRVDDHPEAIEELYRIFDIYSITLLEREDPKEITEITDDVLNNIGQALFEKGYLITKINKREKILKAFIKWIHTENFENKIRNDGYVWNSVLNNLLVSFV